MDCTDDRQPVPAWQSQIIAKVTRIGVEEEDDDDDDEDFQRPPAVGKDVPPMQQQQQQPMQQQQRATPPPPAPAPVAPSFDLFDGPTTQAPAPSSHGYSGGAVGNLFDTHVTAAPSLSGGGGGASLLDMNYQQHPPKQQAHSDFLGMTAAPSPPVSGNLNYGIQQQLRPAATTSNHQPPAVPQPRTNGSFDSFGSLSQTGGGGAFGDLGTPWKS
jgi:hypothetical protein